MVGLARTGRWLDVMVLKVFSSLNGSVAAQLFGVKECTPCNCPALTSSSLMGARSSPLSCGVSSTTGKLFWGAWV